MHRLSRNKALMWSHATHMVSILLACAVGFGGSEFAHAQKKEAVEQLKSDSRSPYFHRITLYDHDGVAISPDDMPAQPYSPAMTCGKCHPVDTIADGWHFGGLVFDTHKGGKGEPWILVRPQYGVALPVSERMFDVAYTLDDVGLSHWQFLKEFGRHLPGGGLAAPDRKTIDASDEFIRWDLSGVLEVDCMMCHSKSGAYDSAEVERQIARENVKYAATAALGLAVIRGDMKNVPDDFDPYAPPNPDFPEQRAPGVIYDKSKFDPDDRVIFDVTRNPPVENCYFCHTASVLSLRDSESEPNYPSDHRRPNSTGDVHLAAGMVCTDCHRNGIDHHITRGYAMEWAFLGGNMRAKYSCSGCHLGTNNSVGAIDQRLDVESFGHYGAPRPEHRGFPPLHFEILTCTACHSGSLPSQFPYEVQTSRAHKLGIASRKRSFETLPHVVEPLFARSASSPSIAPHRGFWPSFWSIDKPESDVRPAKLQAVERAFEAAGLGGGSGEEHRTSPLTDDQIKAVLAHLRCYVRDGFVHYLNGDGELVREKNESDFAGPHLWPLAHDVRPAAQSLGANGCEDCHSDTGAVFFGKIAAIGDPREYPITLMHQLPGNNVDPKLAKLWSAMFPYRDLGKWFTGLCLAVLVAIFLVYGLRGLDSITRRIR